MNIKERAIRKAVFYLQKLIVAASRRGYLDLITMAYRENGILHSGTLEETGEQFVIDKVLPSLINVENPVLFDVGGNQGEYAEALIHMYPKGTIYAFEPNPAVFEIMKRNVAGNERIICENVGLGESVGRGALYRYSKIENSGLSTISKDALDILFALDDTVEEIDFARETIDHYCSERHIDRIDLLKMDVEGSELAILKGASHMIRSGKIGSIQFEFNNFNAVYRIFLKDFYDVLPDHDLYRITDRGLLPLGNYDTINEIFKFQNILAVPRATNKDNLPRI